MERRTEQNREDTEERSKTPEGIRGGRHPLRKVGEGGASDVSHADFPSRVVGLLWEQLLKKEKKKRGELTFWSTGVSQLARHQTYPFQHAERLSIGPISPWPRLSPA